MGRHCYLWGVRLKQKNRKKTGWRYLLILSILYVLTFVNASLSFAEWEDRECVVLSIPFDLAKTIVANKATGVNYYISPDGILSASRSGYKTLYGWYNQATPGVRYVQLYYYDLKERTWVMRSQVNSAIGTKASIDTLLTAFPYAKIYVSIASNIRWIAVQLPNGCSDLPSQQSDEPPNFDTGRPGCNDPGL